MQQLICIECPNGCHLSCELENDVLACTGNRCPRGLAYAKGELTHPLRTLTTTVCSTLPGFPVVSVRTDGMIPKELIFQAVSLLSAVKIEKTCRIHDIIIENLLDTGVNVICTTDMTAVYEERSVPHVSSL